MNHRFLYYFNYLAFVPLLVFTTTVQSHGAKFPDRWAYAFLYAFAPAVVFSISALAVFTRCDKLWLGTNLWFALLGALALSRAWGPLELLGTMFKESGGVRNNRDYRVCFLRCSTGQFHWCVSF
jgi:hypothetical protein